MNMTIINKMYQQYIYHNCCEISVDNFKIQYNKINKESKDCIIMDSTEEYLRKEQIERLCNVLRVIRDKQKNS